MARLIAILEDNAERILVMKAWLADRLPMYEPIFTDDPDTLNEILESRWEDILAVSLDHDLYDRPDHTTELTGMIVADFLATKNPAFPIVIHSSNERDSLEMKTKLKRGGWVVTKVIPFDDTNWIGLAWYPAMKKAIRKAAVKPEPFAIAESDRD